MVCNWLKWPISGPSRPETPYLERLKETTLWASSSHSMPTHWQGVESELFQLEIIKGGTKFQCLISDNKATPSPFKALTLCKDKATNKLNKIKKWQNRNFIPTMGFKRCLKAVRNTYLCMHEATARKRIWAYDLWALKFILIMGFKRVVKSSCKHLPLHQPIARKEAEIMSYELQSVCEVQRKRIWKKPRNIRVRMWMNVELRVRRSLSWLFVNKKGQCHSVKWTRWSHISTRPQILPRIFKHFWKCFGLHLEVLNY